MGEWKSRYTWKRWWTTTRQRHINNGQSSGHLRGGMTITNSGQLRLDWNKQINMAAIGTMSVSCRKNDIGCIFVWAAAAESTARDAAINILADACHSRGSSHARTDTDDCLLTPLLASRNYCDTYLPILYTLNKKIYQEQKTNTLSILPSVANPMTF